MMVHYVFVLRVRSYREVRVQTCDTAKGSNNCFCAFQINPFRKVITNKLVL